jgi:hypothetical protein
MVDQPGGMLGSHAISSDIGLVGWAAVFRQAD